MTTDTATTTIRLAIMDDLMPCVAMILQMRQDTFWRHIIPELDHGEVAVLLAHRLLTDQKSCLYVAELDGKLIGLCGGEITQHFLSPSVPILHEWAWWVEDAYRHDRVGGRLWRAVCVWGHQRGARVEFRVRSLAGQPGDTILGTEAYTVKEMRP